MALHLMKDTDEEPVSLEEMKAFLKIDSDDEDSIIRILIKAARQQIEHQLEFSYLQQDYTLETIQEKPSEILINIYPVLDIEKVSVQYKYSEGELKESKYKVCGVRPTRIYIEEMIAQESLFPRRVEIKFKSGHRDKESIPFPLRLAILKLVAHNYEFRDVSEDVNKYQVPNSITDLIAPYKVLKI